MNPRSILSVSATITLVLALFGITAGSTARAAEIKLLCAVALQPAMVALIPDFEKSSGHKVTIAHGTAGAVADRVQKGEAADIARSSVPLIDPTSSARQSRGLAAASSSRRSGLVSSCARVPRSPTSVRPTPSNARCWPQDRLHILIRPAGVPVASTWPPCSNDWASLWK